MNEKTTRRTSKSEANMARRIEELVAAAPPLSDRQKAIIRGVLLPVIRRQRGEAA